MVFQRWMYKFTFCCFLGVCKDTVASISEPVQKHSYGLSDGTWMRDARGHGNVIYLTNGHYGNILLEFRDMESFKTGIQFGTISPFLLN